MLLALSILYGLNVNNVIDFSQFVLAAPSVQLSSIHLVDRDGQLPHLDRGLWLELVSIEAKVENLDDTLAARGTGSTLRSRV